MGCLGREDMHCFGRSGGSWFIFHKVRDERGVCIKEVRETGTRRWRLLLLPHTYTLVALPNQIHLGCKW